MCKGCSSQAKLRDTPIEPEEFAKIAKARRTADPRIGYHFPGGQRAQVHQGPGKPLAYQTNPAEFTENTREYVTAFCEINNLTGTRQ